MRNRSQRRGQSLIELMIGVVVAGILVGGAALIITTTLRVSRENVFLQRAWFVNQAGADAAAAIAQASWRTVYGSTNYPTPGAAGWFSTDVLSYNQCGSCLLTGTCPDCNDPSAVGFCAQGGICSLSVTSCGGATLDPSQLYRVPLDGVNYYICFRVEPVYRDGGGAGSIVSSGGDLDPSTALVSVKTRWGDQGQFQTPPLQIYLTRYANDAFVQTDWSGGGGQSELWLVRNQYDTGSGVDVATVPGQVTVGP